MAESATHLELVCRIVSFIRTRYADLEHVSVLHDLPDIIGSAKPPKIGGFKPDIYAIDAPLTKTIIGEAKTHRDLETHHTLGQFRAFLEFLRQRENPVFILAVPWQASARGRSLLLSLRKNLEASLVEIIVIDNIRDE